MSTNCRRLDGGHLLSGLLYNRISATDDGTSRVERCLHRVTNRKSTRLMILISDNLKLRKILPKTLAQSTPCLALIDVRQHRRADKTY